MCSAAVKQAWESLRSAVQLSTDIRAAFHSQQAKWFDSQVAKWQAESGQVLILNAKRHAGEMAASLDRIGDRFDQLDRHLGWAADAIHKGQKSLEGVSKVPERWVSTAKLIGDELRETGAVLRDAKDELGRTREHIRTARKALQRVIDLPDSSVEVANVAQASFQVRAAVKTAMIGLRAGHRVFSRLTDRLPRKEEMTETLAGLAESVARGVRAEAEVANRGSGPSTPVPAAPTRQHPERAGHMRAVGHDSPNRGGQRADRTR